VRIPASRVASLAWTLAAAGALALPACGDSSSKSGPCATVAAGVHDLTIESGGLARTFRLVVPESAASGAPVPLVVLFHGSNGDGAGQIAIAGFDAKAAEEGFVLAAGDGTDRSWNSGSCRNPEGGACVEDVDDVGFTRDLVAAVEETACIDPARIYATGFSKGAAMVFRLACEAADLFAAFAPVAGGLAFSPCTPERPRPILLVNAADDATVPFAVGEASFLAFLGLNGCDDARESTSPAPGSTCVVAPECRDDATTALCRVPGGHRWPGGATDPDGPFHATDVVWSFFSEQGA
jgi:polyhydroxybutyrate depolymerase